MNVRFFAGTRAQYDSLPSPRNPLGLYFCEDTKELFWADRLLTDGIRVVPTFKDLPEPSKAADGVVYYVTETRNGYVVPHGSLEWLQTIYAPVTDAYVVPEEEIYNTVTTVGAVRDIEAKIYKTIDERLANIEIGSSGSTITAIYFAGKKLDAHDDGTYHIDRLCALRALGFNVPEDLGDEELELVTKKYVDEQLALISNIDLSDYAKKSDLAQHYTKDETVLKIDEALSSIEVPTKVSELDNDAGYIKASDIPDAEIYKVDFNIPDYTKAVEAYNEGKILVLTNAAPDTNSYAVMNYISDNYITFTKFLMSRSSTYGAFNTYYLRSDNTWEVAKEVRLNQVEANADGDIKEELTSLRVGKEIYKLPDLTGYTTTEVFNQTLENYVTEETITEVVAQEVNTVVTEKIETKVTEVIQEKVTAGDIDITANKIAYGEF